MVVGQRRCKRLMQTSLRCEKPLSMIQNTREADPVFPRHDQELLRICEPGGQIRHLSSLTDMVVSAGGADRVTKESFLPRGFARALLND